MFTCPICGKTASTETRLGKHVVTTHLKTTVIDIQDAEDLIYPGPSKKIRRHMRSKIQAWREIHELERMMSLRDRRPNRPVRDGVVKSKPAKTGQLAKTTKRTNPRTRKKQ